MIPGSTDCTGDDLSPLLLEALTDAWTANPSKSLDLPILGPSRGYLP